MPTPWKIVDDMLQLARCRQDDYVMDLGSGDGRLVITAAERFGSRGYGVDIDPKLVELANRNAAKAGVADRVKFEKRDLFETSLGDASVLTLYLLPHTVTQLVPRILAEMKPGARVVSHDYPLGPWQHDRHVQFDVAEKVEISGTTRTVLYLYIVPARIGGHWTLELPAAMGAKPGRLQIVQEPFSASGTATLGGATHSLDKLAVRGEDVQFRHRRHRCRPQAAAVRRQGARRFDRGHGQRCPAARPPGAPPGPGRASGVSPSRRAFSARPAWLARAISSC